MTAFGFVSHGEFIWRLLGVLIPERELEKDIQEVNLCHLFNCTKHLFSSF